MAPASLPRKEFMKLNQPLKDLLLKIHGKLPPEKRAEFAARVRERLRYLRFDDLAGYTITGALLGAICEILPLDFVTGIDDWVEVGAALGATVGYALTKRQRQTRQEIEQAHCRGGATCPGWS